jgi:hypothetical protein
MQSNFRRYLIAGSLAAALTMAGAAPANARDLGTAGHAWAWLQDVWTQGISALWPGHGRVAPSSGRAPGSVPITAKQGLGLDPNGSPQANSAGPACTTCGDQGLGLDPNS